MALNPENLPSDKLVREVVEIYTRAQRELASMILRAIADGKVDTPRQRRIQYRKVVEFLESIGQQADPLAARAVERAFEDGAQLVQPDIERVAGPSISPVAEAAFFAVNREAMLSTQEALLDRMVEARRTVGRSVNDVFRRKTLEVTSHALLGSAGSPQKASRKLQRLLVDEGRTSFVDKAGRRWKLASYTEMAVRTTTREAVVQGQVNRLAAHGINLVRVSTHGSDCDVCGPFEGRLIDLAGSMTEFQGEAVASGPLPPFHPNCRHTIMGVSQLAENVRRAENLPGGGRGGGDEPPGPPIVGKPLPNARKAVVPERKLTHYALDPDHPKGGSKARVFKSALGFEKADHQLLAQRLLAGLRGADLVSSGTGKWVSHRVDMPIKGPNGNTKMVVTAWHIRNGVPYLVTARVANKQPPEYAD